MAKKTSYEDVHFTATHIAECAINTFTVCICISLQSLRKSSTSML